MNEMLFKFNYIFNENYTLKSLERELEILEAIEENPAEHLLLSIFTIIKSSFLWFTNYKRILFKDDIIEIKQNSFGTLFI